MYSCTCKLEGSQCFQLRISLPEVMGRSTVTNPVNLTNLPKNITTSQMCSVRIRLANSLSTDPTISKSCWTKEQPYPLALFTPYPRRNLQLCISSLTRTSLQGSFIPLGLRVEPQSSSLGKGWLASTLHRFLKPQLNFQERLLSAPTHLRPPRCTENGTGLHQN